MESEDCTVLRANVAWEFRMRAKERRTSARFFANAMLLCPCSHTHTHTQRRTCIRFEWATDMFNRLNQYTSRRLAEEWQTHSVGSIREINHEFYLSKLALILFYCFRLVGANDGAHVKQPHKHRSMAFGA